MRLSDDLDVMSRDSAIAAAHVALDAPGVEELVVSLADVEMMDSSGIGALVQIRRDANNRGVTFRVSGASLRSKRLFTITGLTHALNVE